MKSNDNELFEDLTRSLINLPHRTDLDDSGSIMNYALLDQDNKSEIETFHNDYNDDNSDGNTAHRIRTGILEFFSDSNKAEDLNLFDQPQFVEEDSALKDDYHCKYEKNQANSTITKMETNQDGEISSTLTEKETMINLPVKENKKRGRRKKKDNLIDSSKGHTKASHDNIRRKVKVQFMHFIIRFFNYLIKVYCKGQQKNKFRTFDNDITKDITIKANLLFTLMPLKELLRNQVSRKYTKCDKNQNAKIVMGLLKQKDTALIFSLNMTVKEFYEKVFMANPDGFKTDYLREVKEFKTNTIKPEFFNECWQKEKKREDSYGETMKTIGEEFFEYFETTTPRDRNKILNKQNESE